MPQATREKLKKEIYFDENTPDLNTELKKYEAAKLKYAEFKENEMLEKALQRYENNRKKLQKIIRGLKNLFNKNEHQNNQKER